MPKTLGDGSVDIDGDGVGDYCPAGANCDYGGNDQPVDPYESTKRGEGTLPRKDELEMRLREDPVSGLKSFQATVRGDSMYPNIKPGDQVVVNVSSDIKDMKVGNVITFIYNHGNGTEAYYTHRVNKVGRDQQGNPVILTKGDHNKTPDNQLVTKANFIGKVYTGD
jgi:hypothetical protein